MILKTLSDRIRDVKEQAKGSSCPWLQQIRFVHLALGIGMLYLLAVTQSQHEPAEEQQLHSEPVAGKGNLSYSQGLQHVRLVASPRQ